MGTQSTNPNKSINELYPPNLLELMQIMDKLIVNQNDKDECLSICMMVYDSDADDKEELASFEEAFNMSLIDEALEYAKTNAKTIKDISDFIWERLPELEIVEDE